MQYLRDLMLHQIYDIIVLEMEDEDMRRRMRVRQSI